MGKSIAKVGAVIAGAALIATGIGAAAGVGLLGASAAAAASSAGTLTLFGVSVATLGQVGAGLTALAALTTKRPDVQTGGNPVQQTYDPQAGIPYAVGRTAVGGRIVYGTTTPENNKYRLFYSILSGGGPIAGVEGFYANNELVSFTADSGEGASGTYLNRMWQVRRLGAPGDTALRFTATGSKDTPANHGGNPPEWTLSHKMTGYAVALTACEYDTKKFSGDIQPLWVLTGVKVYDPRLDSTYPGGSGACRAGVESTYVYSENPWLHALTWAIGRVQNGKRVLGFGAPLSAILVNQFVEAANVADANGWKVGGTVYSTDDKWSVMQAMAQAGGGYCVPMGAQIGCVVNAPRVSIGLIKSSDIVGEASAAGTKGRRDRINRIIARYRSEAHNWEVVSAAPIEVAEHVAFDGAQRTREVDYTLVQDVIQAAQLARYDIENSRELEPLVFTLGPAFLGYRAGDCLTVNVPELGLVNQDVIVLRRTFDPASGVVTLQCRSETAAKHPYCLGQTTTPPPTPSLEAASRVPPAPTIEEWVATGATLTDNGVSVPAVTIVGSSSNPNVADLLVQYRPAGAPKWVGPVPYPLDYDVERRIELASGLTSATTYNVQIAYRSIMGVWSDWTDLDDVVAGSFAFDTMGTEDGLLTVYYQATAPASPERGDVWFKTDAGNAPFQWDGTSWVDASNNAAVQAIQFATAAQSTADSKVKVYYQTSTPTASTVGDLWVDTDDPSRRVFRWSGSGWLQIADQTGFNIAAGISGQGSLATQNWVVWATQVTGVGRPEDYANRVIVYRQTTAPSSPGVNDIWVQLNGSGVAIAMWAYNGSVWINGADRTIYNIAAGFSGQGTLATQNQVTTTLIAPNAVSRVAYGEAAGRMDFGTSPSLHFSMAYSSNGGAHIVHVVAEAGVDSWDPTAGASAILYCNGVPLKGASMKIPAGWGQDSRSFLATHTPGAGSCTYTVSYQASPGSGAVHANNTSVMVLELQR